MFLAIKIEKPNWSDFLVDISDNHFTSGKIFSELSFFIREVKKSNVIEQYYSDVTVLA